jgi:hypothetical protein
MKRKPSRKAREVVSRGFEGRTELCVREGEVAADGRGRSRSTALPNSRCPADPGRRVEQGAGEVRGGESRAEEGARRKRVRDSGSKAQARSAAALLLGGVCGRSKSWSSRRRRKQGGGGVRDGWSKAEVRSAAVEAGSTVALLLPGLSPSSAGG